MKLTPSARQKLLARERRANAWQHAQAVDWAQSPALESDALRAPYLRQFLLCDLSLSRQRQNLPYRQLAQDSDAESQQLGDLHTGTQPQQAYLAPQLSHCHLQHLLYRGLSQLD